MAKLISCTLLLAVQQGELLGLKWDDVYLEAGRLSVRRSLKVTEDGLGFGSPKNNASRRSVALNKTALAALKTHRARQNEERLRAPEWRDEDLVFPNRLGKPMDHNNLYHRDFKGLLKKAELEGFTFHSLRHSCATLLLKQNVNPKKAQELLGHANIAETMDTYSHVLPNMQDEVAAEMERALR